MVARTWRDSFGQRTARDTMEYPDCGNNGNSQFAIGMDRYFWISANYTIPQ